MPQEHSGNFNTYINTKAEHNISFNETNFSKLTNYNDISDLLLEVNDARFGIVSKLKKEDGKPVWYRDATSALSLEEREKNNISPNEPFIEANNALLRILSRLRPIDHAIQKNEVDGQITTRMRQKFDETTEKLLALPKSGLRDTDIDIEIKRQIKSLENDFNTFLVEQLHEANLTQGITTKKQAENLLFHYRNLSPLLEPARTLVTLTYDKEANVLVRETHVPVTKKLDEQKEEIKKLETLNAFPTPDEKSAHTIQPLACQKANQIFADLMASDERCLAAQSRKEHLLGGLKNGGIVTVDVAYKFIEGDINKPIYNKEDQLSFARTATIAYVGKGETDAQINKHAHLNVKQLFNAAREINPNITEETSHFMTLNTNNPIINTEKQSEMVKAVLAVFGVENASYVPINILGLLDNPVIATILQSAQLDQELGTANFSKERRLRQAALVLLTAAKKENCLSIFGCASAQDRSGTVATLATGNHLREIYKNLGLNSDRIEAIYVAGGHQVILAGFLNLGSFGMKNDSKAGDTFSPESNNALYLDSANTNKENKVNNVDFLNKASPNAIAEYKEQLTICREKNRPNNPPFKQEVDKLLAYAEQAEGKENSSARDIWELTEVLRATSTTINEITDTTLTLKNVKKLACISQDVSGQSSILKSIAISLLCVGCAALIIVGILAAIPSAGTSLLLTGAGLVGISAASAAGMTIGATTGAIGVGVGVAGIGVAAGAYVGREKELAKHVSDFKEAVHKINKEPPNTIINSEIQVSSTDQQFLPTQSG